MRHTITEDSAARASALLLFVTKNRKTFRRIVLRSAFNKRRMYESFLENVPLLQSLDVSQPLSHRTY